jgi:hypothetical protein
VWELPEEGLSSSRVDKLEEACARERTKHPKNRYGLNQMLNGGVQHGCLAWQKIVSFYRSKGMMYNVWFTGASTPYFRTNITLEDSQAAYFVRFISL